MRRSGALVSGIGAGDNSGVVKSGPAADPHAWIPANAQTQGYSPPGGLRRVQEDHGRSKRKTYILLTDPNNQPRR